MSVVVRRAASRARTDAEGRTTYHSFAFGAHYDPDDVGFGPLLAHNEEILPAGTGYAAHRHRDVEIVTVVLSGALRHESDVGSAVLRAGDVQRLTAGSGVVHAETNAADEVTRFVQTWLRPGREVERAYEVHSPAYADGVTPLLRLPGAELHAVRTGASEVRLADAAWLHVFVVEGEVRVAGHDLAAGDVVRVSEEARTCAISRDAARLLVWCGPTS